MPVQPKKKKKLGLDVYTEDARQMNPVFFPTVQENLKVVAAGGR